MRLKFRTYEFDIWGSLRAVFINVLEKIKTFLSLTTLELIF